jgi:hypothetical protein
MNLDEKEAMNDEQVSNLNGDIIDEMDLIDHRKCNDVHRLNDSDESLEQQQFQDEGFQDKGKSNS